MSHVSEIRNARSAQRQASEWLVLMREGDPSPEERARFEAWRQEPGNGTAYAELEGTWGRLQMMGRRARVEGIGEFRDSAETRLTRSARRTRTWPVPAWTVASLLIALFAAFHFLHLRGVQMQYATVIGERKTAILPDGSKVELNTDTALSVAYSPNGRNVALERGEAYFDVASDPSRPFLVAAGPNAVRAVGTRFVVRLISPRTIAVTVTEGTVELTNTDHTNAPSTVPPASDKPAPTLTEGERAEIDRRSTRIERLAPDELVRSQAWRKGILIFNDQPLDEVVPEVNRYTDTRIVIADAELNSLRIGGTFRAGDVEGLLEVLKDAFGIAPRRVAGHTVYLHASHEVVNGE